MDERLKTKFIYLLLNNINLRSMHSVFDGMSYTVCINE